MVKQRAGVVVVAHLKESVRQIVREALEASGLEVHTTERGEEALELARRHRPRVLLLSLDLWELNGWSVVDTLRQQECDQVVVVALTADARQETRERALACGFTRYLTLPIEPFDLLDRLDALGVGRRDA